MIFKQDEWWNTALANDAVFYTYPTPGDVVGFTLDETNWITLTPEPISTSALRVEYTEQMGVSAGTNISVKYYVSDCNDTFMGVKYLEDTAVVQILSGHSTLEGTIFETISVPFSAYGFIYWLIEARDGIFSAAYRTTSGGTWNYFNHNPVLSSCGYTMSAEGSSHGLFTEINISAHGTSAETGLPINHYSSSATEITATYLTSGFEPIDIIGSTIYTDSGFETERIYIDSSLSAVSTEFNITDSVIVGL